jgi:hypothetical protein
MIFYDSNGNFSMIFIGLVKPKHFSNSYIEILRGSYNTYYKIYELISIKTKSLKKYILQSKLINYDFHRNKFSKRPNFDISNYKIATKVKSPSLLTISTNDNG